MARNFALMTSKVQLVKVLEKYGRERLRCAFEPHLMELEKLNYFPRATNALNFLRGKISLDEYLS